MTSEGMSFSCFRTTGCSVLLLWLCDFFFSVPDVYRNMAMLHFFMMMTCNLRNAIASLIFFKKIAVQWLARLIIRIFNLKKKWFLNYLTETHGLFSRYIAYGFSVEYQQQSLCYLHCFQWRDEASKPRLHTFLQAKYQIQMKIHSWLHWYWTVWSIAHNAAENQHVEKNGTCVKGAWSYSMNTQVVVMIHILSIRDGL